MKSLECCAKKCRLFICFYTDGSSNTIHGHGLTLAAMGVFVLWIGWFGFNAGSTLTASDPEAIAHVMVTTNLAPAAAAVTTLVISWIKDKPSVEAAMNGALAGLVGVTAGCDLVSPFGAIIIGIVSGIVMMVGTDLLEHKFKLDDAVGAISVHGFCGVAGTILTGLLATTDGLLYGGGVSFFGVQVLGALVIAFWGLTSSFVIFNLLKHTIGLRVTKEEEIKGLDLAEHGECAYAEFLIRKENSSDIKK